MCRDPLGYCLSELQALIYCHLSDIDKHKAVKLSTYGIIFLGTPHQGGEGVALGTRLVDVASIFFHTNKNLLSQLKKESEKIQDQLLNYRGIQGQFVTIFAYETLPNPRGILPPAIVSISVGLLTCRESGCRGKVPRGTE